MTSPTLELVTNKRAAEVARISRKNVETSIDKVVRAALKRNERNSLFERVNREVRERHSQNSIQLI
jgi:hypothetical protein